MTPQLQQLRVEVDKGRLPWSQFLDRQNLRVACDALHYFAFWQTPLDQHKRWSTRFFLAEAPPDQDATHDGSEVTDIRWVTVREALDAARERTMKLPLPTIANLKDMEPCQSVAEMIAWANERQRQGIIKLRPILVDHHGRQKWVVWGDEGYPYDQPQ